MDLDLAKLSRRERHGLLSSIVVPRPIAFVTTMGLDGTVNAAPFSFFNIMGLEPPVVALGPDNRRSGEPKDTARNIRQTGEFVVNIVDEALAEKMNLCAIDFPPDVDELALAGLTPVASTRIRPPRIGEAPAALECREVTTLEIGHNRIVLGEVVHLHLRDDLVRTDPLEVRTGAMNVIGRMHNEHRPESEKPNYWYVRASDLFDLPRQTYAQWERTGRKGP